MKKDDKKPVYIPCPRCELNYINKKDKYCTVCKAELGMLDRAVLIPDDEDYGDSAICPVCRTNPVYGDYSGNICFECRMAMDGAKKGKDHGFSDAASDENLDVDEIDKEDEFMEEIENVDDIDDIEDIDDESDIDDIPLPEFDEDDEEEEEEDEMYDSADEEPDDFNYDVDPNDFEEDDEEEDDYDDEDDDF